MTLDKVDSAGCPLCSACPLPTQTCSVPSGQLSALGGLDKRPLEIFFGSFLRQTSPASVLSFLVHPSNLCVASQLSRHMRSPAHSHCSCPVTYQLLTIKLHRILADMFIILIFTQWKILVSPQLVDESWILMSAVFSPGTHFGAKQIYALSPPLHQSLVWIWSVNVFMASSF